MDDIIQLAIDTLDPDDHSPRTELVSLLLGMAMGVHNWQHQNTMMETHFLDELDNARALVRRIAEEAEP